MRNMMTIFQPGTSQVVTTNTSTAANATAISDQTYAVRLHATTDTFVDFEKAATKTTSIFLKGGVPENFAIQSKAVISSIADSVAGKIGITELTS